MTSMRIFAFVLVLFGSSAMGHDSLYNYLEIQIDAKDGALIHFSVHAAELSEDSEVDPASQDTAWFSQLTANQKRELIGRANEHLERSYQIKCGDKSLAPPPFSNEAQLDSETRPGCLSSSLKVTETQGSVIISYTGSEKRLLLVVTKTGAFPKTYDLANGESKVIPLAP